MDGDYPVVLEMPVRWGEMDAFGHVNNTVYFRWFEDVRIATFERIAIGSEGTSGVGPILATTTADFRNPLTYPTTIRVGCRIPKVGNTSFVMEYAVQVVETGAIAASGSGVIVMVDYTTGQKVPVPEAVRAGIAALAGL